jgi:Prokaryotic homologs of the JAB domain
MEVAEAAVVIDQDDHPIYWHLPEGRTAASIPDSRDLWMVLWNGREQLAGVAHTHPAGVDQPSSIDLVTFRACEDGLGRRLSWWIVTPTEVMLCSHDETDPRGYRCHPDPTPHAWVELLRHHSWPTAEPYPGEESPTCATHD